jgi:hypothetical protein
MGPTTHRRFSVDPIGAALRTLAIDTSTLSFGGLVARPGVFDVGGITRRPLLRPRRIPLIDLLAAACLDALADVLLATSSDGRRTAAPLRDVLASSSYVEVAGGHAHLVVPGWCERADEFHVVRMVVVTFSEFLGERPNRDPQSEWGAPT